MEKRIGTVGFIIAENKVLLALIQYSEDKKLWNGLGGFVNPGELPEDALVREFSEETHIKIHKADIQKITEIHGDITLLIYRITKWQGAIIATDPSIKDLHWFTFDEIPYAQMHPGNDTWLPEVLSNHK